MVKRILLQATFGVGLVVVAGTNGLAGQQAEGWIGWFGCWEPVKTAQSVDAPDGLLCFQPNEAGGGVEIISVEDGEITARETVRADGRPHSREVEGCNGTETLVFSMTPGRLFSRALYECEGGTQRETTGMFAMISPDSWLDVRTTMVGNDRIPWVTRYRLASEEATTAVGLDATSVGERGLAVRSYRLAGSDRISTAEVIEAVDHVGSDAVIPWIGEHERPLVVDADELIRLADADVGERLIDVIIARSYPEDFAFSDELVTQQAQAPSQYGYGTSYYPQWGYSPFGSRWGLGYSPYYGFGYGLRGYGFGYGYGLGGYGYGYPYYGYGYGGSRIVRVQEDGGGRVISGEGYRMRRPASIDTPSTTRVPAATRGAVRRGGSSGTTVTSGSTSRSTGRTARRRGGGE